MLMVCCRSPCLSYKEIVPTIVLKQHTEKQTLDFYHATGYLKAVASAAFPRSKEKQRLWLDTKCHELKHIPDAAENIFDEMKTLKKKKLSKVAKDNLDSSIRG